jgi:arylsulfatase
MVFNGAAPVRVLTTSPGKYSGQDNGWALSLIYPVVIDFDKSIMKHPSITRYVGGASNDLVPNLQHPENPVPLLKDQIEKLHIGGSGG